MLVRSSTKDARRQLQPGASMQEVRAALGSPKKSTTFERPLLLSSIVPDCPVALKNVEAASSDSFEINGLTETERSTDGSTSDGVVIEAGLTVITAGLFQVLAVPMAAKNLNEERKELYEVTVWYDHAGKYIAHERKSKEANQAPVPTATSVTPAADAPVAPAAAAAQL